ncbi:MAG: ATP-dependent protease [Deltaproteobacteria bacterium HGW-Deltaproteobacteria-21]|nr:MAG: ATP-dependent protease [Deltaproteobacteria bacterium HGW-Deltaproteobacteria-21]
MDPRELGPEGLYHATDPKVFSFESTAEIQDLKRIIGQPRAVEALRFGVEIDREGYNVFAVGHPGTGKHTLVCRFLKKKAETVPVPPDVCYVNNFAEPHKPKMLRMPPGRGRELSHDMERIIEDGRNALKAAFENEEYQNRARGITQEFQDRQQQAVEELQKKTQEKGLTLFRTPTGLAFAPVKEGNIIPPDEFSKLPEEERKRLEQEVQSLQESAQKMFIKVPAWERELRDKMRSLNQEISTLAVGPLLQELREKFKDVQEVVEYLQDVEKDMIENLHDLLPRENPQQQGPPGAQQDASATRKYRVNVLVDNSKSKGGPVIYEDNPTYQNLAGRIEHLPHMGTLLTDFNMIRAGAFHRANGGYLVLDAVKVLMQPYSWEGLKRTLRARKAKIESLGELYGLISTVSIDPEPIPLNMKVVLMGPPNVYYLLQQHDPEFSELFKVTADFDVQMNRTPETQEEFGRLVGTVARQEGLRPLDRGAVARVIERSARMVGDAERLSIHMQSITDLLRESDFWSGKNGGNGNGTITAADVDRAVEAWVYRSDRIRERMQEEIQRGTIFIDTDGKKIGQINGLSVMQLGGFAFGRPSRITARVRLGKGEVVDIEREVEMGGPIHSKGVLILSGYLGARFATEQPFSLSASLVFEQSYGGIEGDSASSAELYALLSAIGEIPVKQSLAVTGSVNQHGMVQPIGGVNEKIEGFFDTCRRKGLTGDQGVLIPKSNVKHLMLRKDVVEAVREGKFHVYPVETIDEGIEILTGMAAGVPDANGSYLKESVNGKVHARLLELAEKARKFSAQQSAQGGKE